MLLVKLHSPLRTYEKLEDETSILDSTLRRLNQLRLDYRCLPTGPSPPWNYIHQKKKKERKGKEQKYRHGLIFNRLNHLTVKSICSRAKPFDDGILEILSLASFIMDGIRNKWRLIVGFTMNVSL